jgi:hypothetical protein
VPGFTGSDFEGAIFGSCQKAMLLIKFLTRFKVFEARHGFNSRLINYRLAMRKAVLLEKARFGSLVPRQGAVQLFRST